MSGADKGVFLKGKNAQGTPFFLIGEIHEQPMLLFRAIWTALQIRHPNARIFIESASMEVLLQTNVWYALRQNTTSPLAELAKYADLHRSNNPWIARTVHIDARRFPLYHLWEAFIHPLTYNFWASAVQKRYVYTTHEQRKHIEKELSRHMKSKRAMRRLLADMMFHNKVQVWYANIFTIVGSNVPTVNPIYEAYTALSKKQQRKVAQFFKEATSWTLAADAIEKTRRTASALYAVVMDVFAVIQILGTPSTLPIIFVGGREHAWNIARFLEKHMGVLWNEALPKPTYILHLEQNANEWNDGKEQFLDEAFKLIETDVAI